MSSIATHPEFPFIRIGQVAELDPDDGPEPLFSPTHWMLEVLEVEDGGDPVRSRAYRNREEAVAAAEAWLFSPNRGWLVERHIKRAWEEGKLDLVVKLAEGRGRAAGYSKGQGELAVIKARVMAALG